MKEKQVKDDLFDIILNIMINHNGKNSLLMNTKKKKINKFFIFQKRINLRHNPLYREF